MEIPGLREYLIARLRKCADDLDCDLCLAAADMLETDAELLSRAYTDASLHGE